MKTHVFWMLLLSTVIYSQNPTTTSKFAGSEQPPNIVLTSFTTSYANTKAQWTNKEEGLYYAEYIDDANMGKVIVYDNRGNLVAVENELHNGSYPTAIASYYIKTFPKEKFVIWSHYDTDDHKTYFAKREQETVWFDRDGNYTHSVKKRSELITKKS